MTDFFTAQRQADNWCSVYIRLRDALATTGTPTHCRCISCRKIKPIEEFQNGHYIDRECKVLRYDEENNNAQCAECNMDRVNKGIIHECYGYGLDRKYGDGTRERLRQRRIHEQALRSPQDLIEIAHHFRKKYLTLSHK